MARALLFPDRCAYKGSCPTRVPAPTPSVTIGSRKEKQRGFAFTACVALCIPLVLSIRWFPWGLTQPSHQLLIPQSPLLLIYPQEDILIPEGSCTLGNHLRLPTNSSTKPPNCPPGPSIP